MKGEHFLDQAQTTEALRVSHSLSQNADSTGTHGCLSQAVHASISVKAIDGMSETFWLLDPLSLFSLLLNLKWKERAQG